jgi:hypothetical protein
MSHREGNHHAERPEVQNREVMWELVFLKYQLLTGILYAFKEKERFFSKHPILFTCLNSTKAI